MRDDLRGDGETTGARADDERDGLALVEMCLRLRRRGRQRDERETGQVDRRVLHQSYHEVLPRASLRMILRKFLAALNFEHEALIPQEATCRIAVIWATATIGTGARARRAR